MVLYWLSIATLALYAIVALDVMVGNRSVRSLRGVSPAVPAPAPRVSVITAARNEARNVREAIGSLLAIDWPDLELIVVDDRSDDGTGAILDELAAASPRLRVLHVTDLPAGWLGKNHALWVGSRAATGDFLLFTDADVVQERTALARAVRFAEENGLDHLAVTPRMAMPGFLLSAFGLSFMLFFSMFARPWKARDPRSRHHIGIGAFNLVRSSAYRAVGGHEPIRLRPDDDLKLGKILKKAGFRSDVAYGSDFLSVEWYASLGEAVRGLEKNAFAGCDYRLATMVGGVAFHLACSVWPYAALLVTTGATRLVYLAVVVLLTVLVADCGSFHRAPRRHAILFPAAALIFCWIVARTTFLNLARGGIVWRGTFYPLAELRANRV